MKLFGRNKKEEIENEPIQEQVEEEEEELEIVEQPLAAYYIDYMGGHPQYPKQRNGAAIALWTDSFGIYFNRDEPANITVPYSTITNIESMTEQQMKLGRVLAFGIIGALWKKKQLYTLIEFKNEHDIACGIVLDLDRAIEKVQSLIYEKMIESKRTRSL